MTEPAEYREPGDADASGDEGQLSGGAPRWIASTLVAEARVVTERSSRYLVQLCRHVNLLALTRRRSQAHAE